MEKDIISKHCMNSSSLIHKLRFVRGNFLSFQILITTQISLILLEENIAERFLGSCYFIQSTNRNICDRHSFPSE